MRRVPATTYERATGMENLHGCAAVVVADGPIQENVKVKFIDRSDQSPRDEAEVIHWMHVRATAFCQRTQSDC